jgi:O-antigen/teichoic acid export membrane protein
MTVSAYAHGLKARIARGVAAGALGQAINVAGRLLLVPLFLTVWGAESYGEWLLLSSLAAWVALSDLGGQVYFINRLTATWAVNDRQGFQRILATGLLLFMVIPAVLFVLLMLIALVVPVSAVIPLNTITERTATAVFVLLALHACISLPQGLLLGVYRAIGMLPTSVMFANAILTTQLTLSILVLLTGMGMITMALAQILPIIGVTLLVRWDLKRRLGSAHLVDPRQFDRATAKEALHPSLHFFGIQIAQAVSTQGSVLAVGWALGAVEVAIFATIRTLVNIVRQLLGLIIHSAWPEFTRLHAASNDVQLRRLFVAVFRGTLLLALAFIFLMEVAGELLFDAWIRGALSFQPQVTRAFSLYVLITVYWTLGASLLMATNRHIALTWMQLIASGAGVLLCFAGSLSGHLEFAVAGLIAGEALPMAATILLLMGRYPLGISSGLLLKETWPILVTGAVVFFFPMASLIALAWLALRSVDLIRLRPKAGRQAR